MKTTDLAAALEACIDDRHVPSDLQEHIRSAARRLRALEAVREAALMLLTAHDNDASDPLRLATHDVLRQALAGVET